MRLLTAFVAKRHPQYLLPDGQGRELPNIYYPVDWIICYIISMFKVLLVILSATLLLSPLTSMAALLYFDPPQVNYGIGDTFSVKIRIDNENQCINAASVVVKFPNNVVKVVDVARGDSIINLWIEDPKIDNESGTVTLTGGIPGGYCGRIEGDPGLTNVLGELIFQTSDKPESREIRGVFDLGFLDESQVLLNDGRGGKANLAFSGAQLVAGDPGSNPSNIWLDSLKKDMTPPDEFTIELYKDPKIINDRYFVVFTTTDKQSGLDHFEAEESDIDREGFKRGTNKRSSWKTVTSPYILEDQTLNSSIKVKAIDKAGNSRTAVYVPDESVRHISIPARLKLIFYSIFFVIPVLSPFLIRRYVRKKKERTALLVSADVNLEEKDK